MILGGSPRSSGAGRAPSPALPTVRCERRKPHTSHTYVANPRSGIDLRCPGLTANRSIAQLLAEHPEYADLRLVGALRHTLEVSAA